MQSIPNSYLPRQGEVLDAGLHHLYDILHSVLRHQSLRVVGHVGEFHGVHLMNEAHIFIVSLLVSLLIAVYANTNK